MAVYKELELRVTARTFYYNKTLGFEAGGEVAMGFLKGTLVVPFNIIEFT